MHLNIPNIITLCRIGLMPVLVLVFFLPEFENQHIVLASMFFVIGITDLFDGYLARKLNQLSKFGAFLDPVADKLTVGISLVLIVSAHPGPLIAIPAAVIIGRELMVSALREWMASIGDVATVKVSFMGKVKTSGQLWAIGFMLYEHNIGSFSPLDFGIILLYISAVLTLWSMVIYLKAAWPSFRKEG